MLEHLPELMLGIQLSRFLKFNEINNMSLASRQCSKVGKRSRQEKVKKWKPYATKWELAWIEDYLKAHSWAASRYHPYIRTLRYRFICPSKFIRYVSSDIRINTSTKNMLLEAVQQKNLISAQHKRLYEWYVLDVMFYQPTFCRYNLRDILSVLELPFAKLEFYNYSICAKDDLIFAEQGDQLVGVLTKNGVIWKTRLWDDEFNSLFEKLCIAFPVKLLRLCNCCPFCGIDLRHEAGHTIKCMLLYASWFGSLFSFWDRTKKRRVFRKVIDKKCEIK